VYTTPDYGIAYSSMAVLWNNTSEINIFLSEDFECYKDTHKTYDITKLTAKLNSGDNVWYRNKIYYFLGRSIRFPL